MALVPVKSQITLGQYLWVAMLLAILVAIAFLAAAVSANVLFSQVLYTVRVTMVLFTITMCLYVLPHASTQRANYWLLFWSASFVSYAIHVYYSFFKFFHGSITEFYGAQGAFVATLNVIVTVWWLFDMVVVWGSDSVPKWMRIQRTGIQVLIWLLFFLSTVILHAVDQKQLFVIILGVLQTVAILICLAICLVRDRRRPGVVPAQP
jgi:hypothetical protein